MTETMVTIKTQSKCDIIIPAHNVAHWADWCMDEIIRHDSDHIRDVIVVDDGSERDQTELLKRIANRFHKAKFVQTPGPEHGFAIACNYGATLCSSPYLLFLNTDCLITEGSVEALLAAFAADPNVALSCPISNNSPELTFPMFSGLSYVDMNRLCRSVAMDQPVEKVIMDACTVVGNCLMASKDFFEKSGGFDVVWGKGYGEETDLHMKAFSQGFRGVVALNSYVYHYGSATFRFEAEQELIKKRNYALFMSKWARDYRALAKKCSERPPLIQLKKNIQSSKLDRSLELDVLFYLPGLNQSVGGIHAVVNLCNTLVREGVRATCAIVGELDKSGENMYREPLLFDFLHYPSNSHFLADVRVTSRIVVSTIFSSAQVVSAYAHARGAKHLMFIQGYEAYFDGGKRFDEFVTSLKLGDAVVTTSRWLEQMIGRHLPARTALHRMPLGINEFIFHPIGRKKSGLNDSIPVVGAVLRSAPDKGQGIVIEVLDRLLARGNYRVIVFNTPSYRLPRWWPTNAVTVVELPAEQVVLARYLREIDVFVDASLHEGFGLMPLEALACGCRVVCSDSGGVRDFVNDGLNGFIVKEMTDPEKFLHKIDACLEICDIPELPEEFHSSNAFEQYSELIKKYLASVNILTVPKPKNFTLQWTPLFPRLPLRARLYGVLIMGYLRMRPYVPLRIHLALKALFGQLN